MIFSSFKCLRVQLSKCVYPLASVCDYIIRTLTVSKFNSNKLLDSKENSLLMKKGIQLDTTQWFIELMIR